MGMDLVHRFSLDRWPKLMFTLDNTLYVYVIFMHCIQYF